ncbi:MAG: hypothetical protein ACFCUH_03585 [Flavobacteriales bacterium]
MSQLNGKQREHEWEEEGESFAARKSYFQASAVVAFLFIAGLLVLQTFKTPYPDLTTHYYHELPSSERQRLSLYDWDACRSVKVTYRTETSGMVMLRASNGEILFSSFAEEGVDTAIEFPVPQELNALIFEHRGDTLHLDIREGEVTAFAF